MLADSYPMFVGGTPDTSNTDLAVVDKYTGQVATRVPLADPQTIDRAIDLAVAAAEPMRQLAANSDLVDSMVGHGIQHTWPRQLWPLRVPIDHLLHSPSLTTTNRRVGPFLGSDHRPVHTILGPAARD